MCVRVLYVFDPVRDLVEHVVVRGRRVHLEPQSTLAFGRDLSPWERERASLWREEYARLYFNTTKNGRSFFEKNPQDAFHDEAV